MKVYDYIYFNGENPNCAKQKQYQKQYNQRPEVKSKQKQYQKKYNQRRKMLKESQNKGAGR